MTKVFSIPGRYNRIYEACQFIVAGAEEAGFDSHALFQIELACDEACTNVIEHAYGGEGEGEIRLAYEVKGRAFQITINDDGSPFDPSEVPEPIVPADPSAIEEIKVGGLGIHFMRKLMDEVYFFFDKDHGNRLVMIKHLNTKT